MRPITRAQWEHLTDFAFIDHAGGGTMTYEDYIEQFHQHPPEQMVVEP